MNKNLEELLDNREIVEKLLTLNTVEEIKDYFKNYNYIIKDEEINDLKIIYSSIYSQINKLNSKDKNCLTKLCENELSEISSGLNVSKNAENGMVAGLIIGGIIDASLRAYMYYKGSSKLKYLKYLDVVPGLILNTGTIAATCAAIGGGTGYLVDKYNENKLKKENIEN